MKPQKFGVIVELLFDGLSLLLRMHVTYVGDKEDDESPATMIAIICMSAFIVVVTLIIILAIGKVAVYLFYSVYNT